MFRFIVWERLTFEGFYVYAWNMKQAKRKAIKKIQELNPNLENDFPFKLAEGFENTILRTSTITCWEECIEEIQWNIIPDREEIYDKWYGFKQRLGLVP